MITITQTLVYIWIQSSPNILGVYLLPTHSLLSPLLLPLLMEDRIVNGVGSLKVSKLSEKFSCVCFPLVSINFKFDRGKKKTFDFSMC
jgi:hypothetical protein